MSAHETENAASGIQAQSLVHPVYLNVPMLVSFLAALEGGVTFEDQSTRKSAASGSHERQGKAGLRAPVLPSIFSLDVSGRIKSAGQTDETEEITAVRYHTESSLFNLLRASLHGHGAVKSISNPGDLIHVGLGDLVELSGEVVGNPIQQLLELVAQVATMAGIDLEAILAPPKAASKSRQGNQPKNHQGGQTKNETGSVGASLAASWSEDSASGLRLFVSVAGEILNAEVRDFVMETDANVGAVLTLASEYITPQAQEYLRGSNLRVLGKVTKVVHEGGQAINLTRRSGLGLMQAEQTQEMFCEMKKSFDAPMKDALADPLVPGPALQLLPVAIFI